jgi:phospholipase C
MQENRSMDNMFNGFPGADTVRVGTGHDGKQYTLQAEPLAWPSHDLNHYHYQFLEDFDRGKNDGWDRHVTGFKSGSKCTDPVNHPGCWVYNGDPGDKTESFTYVQQSDVQPYWDMATQFALGDRHFSSMNGPSFGNHQQLIGGQAGHAIEVPSLMPWGCEKPQETERYLVYGSVGAFPPAVGHEVLGGDPCFTYETVANLLDNANVTWHYYVQAVGTHSFFLNAFDAIKAVRYGADWKNISSPDTNVLSDIANGTLPNVSWVMPHQNASDHPGTGNGGPAWVASIVNAMMGSKYWNQCAIIVTWDEWGGLYDHVLPQQYPDPGGSGAFEGLGYRTPLIIISPYAKAGYVSHVQHETASSLHFIENTFGLGNLGLADLRADAYQDVFNFSQRPRKGKPIAGAKPAKYYTARKFGGDDDY